MISIRTSVAALSLAAVAGATSANVPERVFIQAQTRASAQHLQGEYDLADGRLLAVRRSGAQLVVEIDGQPRTALELRPAGHWASADGRLTLEFHAAPNGSVAGVTLKQTR
jgi:hypothetical protein